MELTQIQTHLCLHSFWVPVHELFASPFITVTPTSIFIHFWLWVWFMNRLLPLGATLVRFAVMHSRAGRGAWPQHNRRDHCQVDASAQLREVRLEVACALVGL